MACLFLMCLLCLGRELFVWETLNSAVSGLVDDLANLYFAALAKLLIYTFTNTPYNFCLRSVTWLKCRIILLYCSPPDTTFLQYKFIPCLSCVCCCCYERLKSGLRRDDTWSPPSPHDIPPAPRLNLLRRPEGREGGREGGSLEGDSNCVCYVGGFGLRRGGVEHGREREEGMESK